MNYTSMISDTRQAQNDSENSYDVFHEKHTDTEKDRAHLD